MISSPALTARLAAVSLLETSARELREEAARVNARLVSEVASTLVSDAEVAELASTRDQGLIAQVLDEVRFRVTKAMSKMEAEESVADEAQRAVEPLAARTKTPPHHRGDVGR